MNEDDLKEFVELKTDYKNFKEKIVNDIRELKNTPLKIITTGGFILSFILNLIALYIAIRGL